MRFFLFLILFFLQINRCYCDCPHTGGLSAEIPLRDFIFTGKILRVDSMTLTDSIEINFQLNNPDVFHESGKIFFPVAKYTIKVISQFKGSLAYDTIEFYSFTEKLYCGMSLIPGQDYIIYGNNRPEALTDHLSIFPQGDNRLWSHRCKRTKSVNDIEINRLTKMLK